MQRRIALLLAVLLVMGCVVGTVAAETITVFEQNYTALGAIPSNVGLLSYTSPLYTPNTQMLYQNGIMGIWNNTVANVGAITIAGLQPAVKTNYTVIFNQNSTITSSEINIASGGMRVDLQKAATTYVLYQHWISGTGVDTKISSPILIRDAPVALTMSYDGITQYYTTSISCGIGASNTTSITTKIKDIANLTLPYDQVSGNIIRFSGNPKPGDTNLSLNILSMTQTVEKTGNVTAIGDGSLVSFGVDGPGNIEDWVNGSSFVASTGGSYTFWNTYKYLTVDKISNISILMNQGFDPDVHFSDSLATLNTSMMQAEIDTETDDLTSTFGRAPITWCSLGNLDNSTQAIYAYNSRGLIWRSNYMGIAELGITGSLTDDKWNLTRNLMNIGGTIRLYAHATDLQPAPIPSEQISRLNFEEWVATYVSKGMKIVPFGQWYFINANTNGSTFTENTLLSGESLNFTAHTNGYPARVEIPYVYGTKNVWNVTDSTSVPISQTNDGNIAFYVSDGMTYTIGDFAILAQFTPWPGPYSYFLPNATPFADTSTGTPTSWSWNFGDGTTSVDQNPVHQWTSPGIFHVTLTASNAFSSSTNSTEIEIQSNDFTANQTHGYVPLSVQFTGLAENTTSRDWDFGDGTAHGTTKTPVHTYTSPGFYTVSLTSTTANDTNTTQKVGYIEVLGANSAITLLSQPIIKKSANDKIYFWYKVPAISFAYNVTPELSVYLDSTNVKTLSLTTGDTWYPVSISIASLSEGQHILSFRNEITGNGTYLQNYRYSLYIDDVSYGKSWIGNQQLGLIGMWDISYIAIAIVIIIMVLGLILLFLRSEFRRES